MQEQKTESELNRTAKSCGNAGVNITTTTLALLGSSDSETAKQSLFANYDWQVSEMPQVQMTAVFSSNIESGNDGAVGIIALDRTNADLKKLKL